MDCPEMNIREVVHVTSRAGGSLRTRVLSCKLKILLQSLLIPLSFVPSSQGISATFLSVRNLLSTLHHCSWYLGWSQGWKSKKKHSERDYFQNIYRFLRYFTPKIRLWKFHLADFPSFFFILGHICCCLLEKLN